MFYLEHFGVTDPGRVRENNEDALLVGTGEDETLFAVADGVGGFEAGEVASRLAVNVLEKMEPNDSFEGAVREANRRIRAASKGDSSLSGMGTTVVAIRFGGTRQKPRGEVAHVGDSRAYLLRNGDLKPVTEDHSLVAELVKSGDLTRAEAAEHPQKNLITRAIGPEENVAADTAVLPVEAGDRFLLCSDGLSDMVREERMREILNAHPEDPETPVKRLLSEALEAGGSDNITVVVIDVKEREEQGRSRSRGTREMRAVSRSAPPATSSSAFPETRAEDSGRGKRRRPRKKSLGLRIFGALVRALAVLAVLALALTPVYLWSSTRYFLDDDAGEIVAYRGLPYIVAGYPLNEEWQRTDLSVDEVEPPYRDPIQNNTYYEQDDIEQVLDQMQADARQDRREQEQARQQENRQNSQNSQNEQDRQTGESDSQGRGN